MAKEPQELLIIRHQPAMAIKSFLLFYIGRLLSVLANVYACRVCVYCCVHVHKRSIERN